MKPPRPSDESARLANLRSYQILDTLAEEEFDDLTALASEICGTPVSLITLVDEDRQWFKSVHGLPAEPRETERDLAFCSYAILDPHEPLVVPDARLDERFADNELVENDLQVVFYAGVPIVSPEGYPLGTVCVIDHEPRNLTSRQVGNLRRLSRQTSRLLELRRTNYRMEQQWARDREAYELLRDFSHVIAHDLKAPIRTISQASEILTAEYREEFSSDSRELLAMIEYRTADAIRMINGVLRYSQESRILQKERESVDVRALIAKIVDQLAPAGDCQVKYVGKVESIHTSRLALLQTFQNLIGNAVKFNDKASCQVLIDCRRYSDHYTFTVRDNGPGIPAGEREDIFKLFHTAADGGEIQGHGVGLTIVRRLIEAIGGQIDVRAGAGQGTVFEFTVPAT